MDSSETSCLTILSLISQEISHVKVILQLNFTPEDFIKKETSIHVSLEILKNLEKSRTFKGAMALFLKRLASSDILCVISDQKLWPDKYFFIAFRAKYMNKTLLKRHC